MKGRSSFPLSVERLHELERKEQAAYAALPQTREEIHIWLPEQVWPDDLVIRAADLEASEDE